MNTLRETIQMFKVFLIRTFGEWSSFMTPIRVWVKNSHHWWDKLAGQTIWPSWAVKSQKMKGSFTCSYVCMIDLISFSNILHWASLLFGWIVTTRHTPTSLALSSLLWKVIFHYYASWHQVQDSLCHQAGSQTKEDIILIKPKYHELSVKCNKSTGDYHLCTTHHTVRKECVVGSLSFIKRFYFYYYEQNRKKSQYSFDNIKTIAIFVS